MYNEDTETVLNGVKFVYNCFRESDFNINSMSQEELEVFFDTIAGMISVISTIVSNVDPKLHAIIENSLEDLSLR